VFVISLVRLLALVKDGTIKYYPGIIAGILRNFLKIGLRSARYNLARGK